MPMNAALKIVSFNPVALAAVLACTACGGDDSPPSEDTGGTSGGGGTGGTDTGGGGSGAVALCEHYPSPDERITDFSGYTGAEWGTSETLTGGSFDYTQPDSTTTITLAGGDGDYDGWAHVTATIQPNEYAGFGFWFGPCVDASAYPGVTFVLDGTNGPTEVLIQVQSSRNYPYDRDANKGECSGTWSDGCASNEAELVLDEDTVLPLPFDVAFADLSGGQPIDWSVEGVDATELLGVQWQFNCGDEVCDVDMYLDDLNFILP